ncbi:ABC transporter permease subunit [Gordonia amarae]|uniref:ABC transporter permease subunit n=2 Tax=Gordonia amarae TaxID=36821 RepID=A0A857LQW4_9ACTN|nr:ABC transporter permease [Gordonia amarae]MCS3879884.1 peptide/nickel transport system permease protein [Gordonia amarae]QHN18294.1 ABC transporter permease subunit [Gordonia amarae]QHN22777.1 ABC transporter permease subunit [Gordonia amarae]QHN31681.1 ABC transporter permease subunit [Gordonia amarae]QHN40425.1 ABC transporter permease subunit [Gordonia amarae]
MTAGLQVREQDTRILAGPSGPRLWLSANGGYIASRVGQALLAVLGVYVLVFVIVTVLPGDPVSSQLRNPENNYSEEEIARLLAYYKLDRSVFEQLGIALGRLFSGDLGLSISSHRPVSAVLWEGIPSTLQLAGTAFVFATILAFLIALAAIYVPARFGGAVFRAFPPLFLSMPNFLIGLVIIDIFSFQLGFFAINDYDSINALIYPAITLAIPASAPIAQIFLTALDDARAQQYSTVAISKGISRIGLFGRHLLPNAALPTLTITAIIVGDLLGGSVLTEAIFGRTGIGSIIQTAATEQDVPVLQAAVTLAAVLFLTINLVVDLIYPVLDPRLRKAAAT